MGVAVGDRTDRPLSLFDLADRPGAPRSAPTVPEAPPAAERSSQTAAVEAGAADGGVGGESTLDELLVRAWEGLTAQAAVACPLCPGELVPVYPDADGRPTSVGGGRCDRCGTTLE